MGIDGLLKIGIVVKDLDEATRVFTEVLGLTPAGGAFYEPFGMRYGVCGVGDSLIELMEPMTADGPIGRFMENRGEGLQHMCLEVSNIEEMMSQLREKGVEFVQDVPEELDSAFGRLKYVFISPHVFNGVLVQLMERL